MTIENGRGIGISAPARTSRYPRGSPRYVPEAEKRQRDERLLREDAAREETAQKRRQSVRRGASRTSVVVLSLIAAALLLWLLTAIFTSVLEIGGIKIEGNGYYSAEAITESLDVDIGDKIYDIDRKTVAEDLIAKFPYIKSVAIKRRLPDTIVVTVSEDMPAFYCKVGRDYLIFSDDLRVLESCADDVKALSLGLCEIKLPSIRSAVCGKYVELYGQDGTEYYASVLRSILFCGFSDRISLVSLENKYDIYLCCCGLYKIGVGEGVEMDTKLELAGSIMNDSEIKAGEKAVIDVSVPKESSLNYDKMLILE